MVELTLEGTADRRDPRRARGRASACCPSSPELVGAYYGPDRAQRELVRVGDLPPHLVGAVLAVEDQRFFDHQGVDVLRILGALCANLRSGRVIQGGSTLTQQLVKNFFLTPGAEPHPQAPGSLDVAHRRGPLREARRSSRPT